MILYIFCNNQMINLIDFNGNNCFKSNLKDFLDKLCILNGSSYNGRITSFKYLTNTRNKPGILVDEHNLLFPTRSIQNNDCILLNYFGIKKIKSIDNHSCNVIFKNNHTIIVNEDYRLIKKQIKRCENFINIIKYHNKELML